MKLLKNLVYQIGSDFIYDCVYLLYYKCHKKFKWGESYIDSPDWTKSKKATINQIKKMTNDFNIL